MADGSAEEGEELEEGEVTDDDEKRPEETEPKPICRFYTRGQCTWGMSCRFLHPGVTDKGNYTMFDMIRPGDSGRGGGGGIGIPPPDPYRMERLPPVHAAAVAAAVHHPAAYGMAVLGHHHHPRIAPVVVATAAIAEPLSAESPWERGLRNAKEMLRKANQRKEQDMDFDDKKMNLSMTPDEIMLEKDHLVPGGGALYERDRDRLSIERSPPPGMGYDRRGGGGGGIGSGGPLSGMSGNVGAGGYDSKPIPRIAPAAYDEDPFGRTTQRYRELPAHRMPHYEDERRVRPVREVIVQRAEPTSGRGGDEWNDPWMRSKSPGREKRMRRDRRSFSSRSSYSSSR